MRMRDAYREMLAKATGKDAILQRLKLVRAKLGRLKVLQGRGTFTEEQVEDLSETLEKP